MIVLFLKKDLLSVLYQNNILYGIINKKSKGGKMTDLRKIVELSIDNFDMVQTFECGQCFRWNQIDKNTYMGVVGNQVIEICKQDDVHLINLADDNESYDYSMYFDAKRDYKKIIDDLSKDEIMNKAINYASGIRILNQDEWETLISFIISSNNNIPRIKKIIESLCRTFGNKILYKNNEYYSFPTPKDLQGITIEDLNEIRCGYRSKFILDAVEKINSGEIDLYNLKNLSTTQAREQLLKIKGVGPKVADCVLLFSMEKTECYPMDVWIKRVTENFYLLKESKEKEIKEFACNYWGEYAGFAQQYLFHYARNLKD